MSLESSMKHSFLLFIVLWVLGCNRAAESPPTLVAEAQQTSKPADIRSNKSAVPANLQEGLSDDAQTLANQEHNLAAESSSTPVAEVRQTSKPTDVSEKKFAAPANWQERFSDDAQPLTNQPSITSVVHGESETLLKVKNNGSTTLTYYSAGAQNIQLFQETFEDGEWIMTGWDWCGTGKELFEIPPNSTVDLVVRFWDADKRERMQASFSEKGTKRSGFVVLAIEP